MTIPRAILKPKEEERILAGHPWAYDNEIAAVEGSPAAGDLVDLESSRKRYLGRGFYNPHSKIRVRLVTRSKEGIDAGFWKRRIGEALAFRAPFIDPERDSYRLLFGEADRAPGLIVDVYNRAAKGADEAGADRIAVVQLLCLGTDARRADIVEAVRERLGPVAVIERSDAPVRLLEGLPEPVHFADAEAPQAMTIRENGLLMRARFGTGHKTGHYHDQRDNRAAAAAYARGLSVMDAFCNTGGFGLCALAAEAASVEFVDSSAEALDALKENLALNGLGGKASIVSANVFDHLREAERAKRRYGMIVLDPPAFAKGRDAVEGAWRGYKDINYRAMGLLERGGWLVSCSCSQHFGPDLFLSMLREAAKDAERSLLIAETRYQAKDHPVLAGYPESLYLKCVIAQVR